MPNLQRCCTVHPDHHVDTCQGAVNFLTGAEPLGALWALCGSEVEGAAVSATVISTVDVMINYILWMTRQYRVKDEGSRTPPVYSLPCVIHCLFVSWQPSCVAIDGAVPC